MAPIIETIKRRLGRKRLEPNRDTRAFPNLIQIGRQNSYQGVVYKATPRNLRYFSRTPLPRRAINAIKNPIKMLDWEIVPIDGVNEWNSELKRQSEIVNTCFQHPNESDDFQSMIEQVIEDYLIGAGVLETQISGDPLRPLWMWPVDGLSIQIYSDWNGSPAQAHYAQTVGYGSEFGGGQIKALRDDEILYLRPNPNTATPFGYGHLEIAFNTIARMLSVQDFAGNVAGNRHPSIGLDFPNYMPHELEQMRSFWQNDVEGQGKVPMFASRAGLDGKAGDIKVMRFYPEGDDGLYLKYQEMLARELASAFDLSPQNFGIERDVNRSTSEVAEDRDWDQAIKPIANDIAKALTRHCIHKKLGFSKLRFRWVAMDREDELNTAKILDIRYKNNSLTPDEIRERFGEPPSDHQWGKMTYADVQVAVSAARSAKEIADEDLTGVIGPQPTKAKTGGGS